MVPERISRVLSAYVDGELDARQSKAVARLLRRSSEAREFLRGLQQDAERLRNLPRQTLAADFSEHLLRTIAASGRRPALTVRSQVPSWWGLAATAAVVLLVVGLRAYLYFATLDRNERNGAMAAVQGRPGPEREPDVQELALHAPNSPEREVPPRPAAEIEAPPSSRPAVAAAEAGKGELKSPPSDLLGSRVIKDKVMRLSDPQERVPLAYEFGKLDQAELRRELQNWSAHALDLRCTNPVAGMDRLQTAFTGIRFVIEPDAKAALKLGLGKNPSFAVYFQDVTAEEILAALQQLGNANREDKRPGTGRFESLLVNGMKRDEEVKLWRLFGVDPAELNQRLPKQVPDVQPGAKASDRPARVVAYPSGRSRPITSELKRFEDNGGQRRPGALQIILVLSPPKS